MEPSEPLIHWPQPIFEYLTFVSSFLAAGAVGFRYAALGRLRSAQAPEERALAASLARGAAALGLTGAVLAAVLLSRQLPGLAERRHLSVGALLTTVLPVQVQILLLLAALVGFAVAVSGRGTGWPLALIGVVVGSLRSALFGQWTRLVNPMHVLAGGLWLGTLFVIVAIGLPGVLRSGLGSERKGATVAGMVNRFSPLALVSAVALALFGVVTAWTHLKRLDALWTTPYGWALIVKLCVVGVVVGLGAWNWRRERPGLGSEAAARALRRSAGAEVLIAAIVLAVTAILVSLPTPGRAGG